MFDEGDEQTVVDPPPSASKTSKLAQLQTLVPPIHIDFTKQDTFRNRPILVEGRRLYVCEHYLAQWSTPLRNFMQEYTGLDLPLPNVKYKHFKLLMEVIHPTQRDINYKNVDLLLPLALEFQMEGVLCGCEDYLLFHSLNHSLIEKLWLADKYKLSRLLAYCMKNIKPTMHKMALSGPKYHGLSDRVKVMLLERLHGGEAPMESSIPGQQMERFFFPSETQFATITAPNGRTLHVNPYYVAAWSDSIMQCLVARNTYELRTGASYEELCAFLKAILPVQTSLTVQNVGGVLMAACKLESSALIRKCVLYLLTQAPITVFSKVILLDRCFLHELLDPCLSEVTSPEEILQMTYVDEFASLSTKAKAALMERLASVLRKPGLLAHQCKRCGEKSGCDVIAWICPRCDGYH